VKSNKLKAKIIERNLTQKQIASELGISSISLNHKINAKNDFWMTEIVYLRNRLGLTNEECINIFFDDKVA